VLLLDPIAGRRLNLIPSKVLFQWITPWESFAPPLFSLGIYCSALGGGLRLRISWVNDNHNRFLRGLKHDEFKPPGSVPREGESEPRLLFSFR